MRIIDERTQKEISAADLTKGFTIAGTWASPEAYASIDNVTKFALDNSDYEEVLIYHEYSAEELTENARAELEQQLNETREALEDAIEAFFTCDSLTDFLKLLTNKTTRAVIKRRKELKEALKAARNGSK